MVHRFNQTQYNELFANIDLCNSLFPKAFPKRASGVQAQPLKIGINADLSVALREAGHDVSMKAIRRLLTHWCSRNFYLKGFKKAEHRIDLNGEPAGLITELEKGIAKQKYQERYKRQLVKDEALVDACEEVAQAAV